jgi:hypothetical protein
LWTAVLALLGELRPPAPVSALRLEVELRGAAGRQADLWRGGDAERELVLAAAARLQRRYGETALRRPRLAVDPGDLPERRFLWEAPVPAAMATPSVTAAHAAPAQGSAADGGRAGDLAARPSTQPAQKGKVPWSRPAGARPPARGHPRPSSAVEGAQLLAFGRTHV